MGQSRPFIGKHVKSDCRYRPLLASFGAIIVLATLIAEPFAQQLINFADCTIPVASGNSSALRTGYYMALANANSENLSYDVNLPNAIRRAIFGGDTEGFGVPPNCSSGNCTFDPFYTVGYCSSCDDISGQIRLENSAFTIDPQNNASIPVTEPSEDSIAWDFYSRRFYHNVTYWLPKSFNQQYRPLSISNLPRSCPRQGKEVCEQYQPSFMALGTNGQGGQNFSVLAGFLQGVNSSNPTFPFNTKPIRPNIQQECNAKHSQDWFCQTRGAASCALFPCVRKLLVSVTNGSLNETVLEKIPMPIRYYGMTTASTVANEDCLRQHQNETVIAKGKRSSANAKWLEYPHTSLNNKSEIISDPSTNPSMPGFSTGSPSDQGEPFMLAAECAFGIHFLAVTKLQSYLTAFLTGDVTAQTWQPDLAIPSLASSRDRLAVDQFYQGGNVTFETVASKFESIADSMTAQIRRDGANSVSSDPALGVITTNRTCIRVRWAWMVYPCILAVLVSTFLIAVIVEGARSDRMGWKTSILPVLFHGLETPPQDVAQTLNDEKDMKKGASSISVRLARSAQGWKLVESRTDKE